MHQNKIWFSSFRTRLGLCGIAWGKRGVLRLQLPEVNKQKLLLRLQEDGAEIARDLPLWIQSIVTKIQAHLAGNLQDLSQTKTDINAVTNFYQRVYQATQKIPPGHIKTYGEIAKEIGSPLAYRAVGQALGKNPIALIIPCHRVLGSGNKLGGFSAYGGQNIKRKLLSIEQVTALPRPKDRGLTSWR